MTKKKPKYSIQNETYTLRAKYKPSPDQEKTITEISNNYKSSKDKQVLLGVTGSGKTFVMANLIARLEKPALVLSHNKTLAAQLFEEFQEFFPKNAVRYFVSYYDYYQPEAYVPSKDMYIEKEADINKQIERFRMSAMNSAVSRRDTIIVASVSCIYNIGDPSNYENKTITLSVGHNISISTLSRELSFMRYDRLGEDFQPGKFRVKGDVFDIFTPYQDFPVRVEFFGDEIERIYYFDSITGHNLGDIKEIEIFPGKNFIFETDIIAKAVKKIKDDLQTRVRFLKNIGKELEAQRLEQRTKYDIEMLEQVGYCKGMENYSIYFEDRNEGDPPYTLLDYFPEDYLLFVDESHMTIPQVRGMYNGDRARKEVLIEHGFRLPTARDNRPLNFAEFQKKQGGNEEAPKGGTIYVSATPDNWEIVDSNKTVVELLTRPTGLLDPKVEVRPTKNQIDDVINEVQDVIAKKQRVLITTLTKKMSEDLSSYLRDVGIKAYYLHSDIDTVERVDILRDLRLGEYDVLVGINLLREGIDLPEVSLVIILDADKEGFLRSKTSLVQIMGRAARHQEGRVLLYADTTTESMKYAIDETNRRREYQEKYNKKHGITPTTIEKAIRDRLVEKEESEEIQDDIDYKKWIEEAQPPESEIKRVIKSLSEKMKIHAENLEFEKAAQLRDRISQLKDLK
ncbi:excinuclease ABC subunit UvrB [Candidatus Dojkabacteria bacterium]|nr:excinuclease ABC subunit UvrB [Candidatus Dojkabacteria bacterium]